MSIAAEAGGAKSSTRAPCGGGGGASEPSFGAAELLVRFPRMSLMASVPIFLSLSIGSAPNIPASFFPMPAMLFNTLRAEF